MDPLLRSSHDPYQSKISRAPHYEPSKPEPVASLRKVERSTEGENGSYRPYEPGRGGEGANRVTIQPQSQNIGSAGASYNIQMARATSNGSYDSRSKMMILPQSAEYRPRTTDSVMANTTPNPQHLNIHYN
jgi:hypothetical protein